MTPITNGPTGRYANTTADPWRHCVTCTCCASTSSTATYNAADFFDFLGRDILRAPTPLDARLARRERERKLLSDQRSRASSRPQRGAPPRGAQLPTYRDAMAARMAARRVA